MCSCIGCTASFHAPQSISRMLSVFFCLPLSVPENTFASRRSTWGPSSTYFACELVDNPKGQLQEAAGFEMFASTGWVEKT